MVKGVWYFPRICTYYYYVNHCNRTPENLRMLKDLLCVVKCGWHLSYFGGAEFIQNKIMNYSHQEYNSDIYTNLQKIDEDINTKTDMFGLNDILSIPISENDSLPPMHEIFFGPNGGLKSMLFVQYEKNE